MCVNDTDLGQTRTSLADTCAHSPFIISLSTHEMGAARRLREVINPSQNNFICQGSA